MYLSKRRQNPLEEKDAFQRNEIPVKTREKGAVAGRLPISSLTNDKLPYRSDLECTESADAAESNKDAAESNKDAA